jgi:peptide/nickel transport system permease protein
MVLVTILAPVLARSDPDAIVGSTLSPPSGQFPLGTDGLGRDVLSRVIWGGRTPFLVAAASVLIATVLGTVLGILGGMLSGISSGLIMRSMDVLLAFPGLVLAFAVVAILGIGQVSMIVAITVAFIPVFARISFSSTLTIKHEDYVMIARGLGLRSFQILIRHVLPNLASEVVVVATSAFGWALLTEATLEFLGMGTRPPAPDWGADLSQGANYIASGSWWVMFGPGVAITICILCANLFGDELARVLGTEGGSFGRVFTSLTGFGRRGTASTDNEAQDA